jgi:hypothetical protein
VFYALNVLEPSGAPASSVDPVVTLERTGERVQSRPWAPYPAGTYPLIDDGSTNKLLPGGDAVSAVATKGSASVHADFVFGVPGGCHVHRVSGPDTVSLP